MGLDIEKKIADHYNKSHGGQQQEAQAAPPAQPQQQQQAAPPAPAPAPQQEKHHHGAGIVKGLGNAAVFGAGATAGGDLVNNIIN